MNLNRLSDESLTDYKIRICSNKSLLNLTWIQVSEILNKETNQDFGESAYRKWFQNFADGLEYANNIKADTDERLDELDEKIREYEIAKIQYQDKTREYKKYLRHDGRVDNLLKKLLDSIKDEINTKKPLEWIKPVSDYKVGNGALTLLLSDLHKGMVTDNHWNKFNDTIFKDRMNQLVQEVLEYQKITGTKELHIMQLGDLIEGNLHRLTKIGENENVVEQTKNIAEALSEMTAMFALKFEKVIVYSVKGNHDRVSSRKEEEIKTESFHDFVTWYMEARLGNCGNVTFMKNEYDDEIIVADICGNTYFGVHGHLDSHNNVVQNLTMMIKKFPTAVFSAHVHKNFENEIHSVDLIVNGGFAGTNNYAKDGRWTSKPHQKLLWLDENGRRSTFYIKF